MTEGKEQASGRTADGLWERGHEVVTPADAGGAESLPPTGGPEKAGTLPPTALPEVKIIRDWDADVFHRRVLELESKGYAARRETYRVTPETHPETGEIIHLYSIELPKL
ncbi:MAG TPA: hypothetical protein VI455_17535 [Terriglobia bacterium]